MLSNSFKVIYSMFSGVEQKQNKIGKIIYKSSIQKTIKNIPRIWQAN